MCRTTFASTNAIGREGDRRRAAPPQRDEPPAQRPQCDSSLAYSQEGAFGRLLFSECYACAAKSSATLLVLSRWAEVAYGGGSRESQRRVDIGGSQTEPASGSGTGAAARGGKSGRDCRHRDGLPAQEPRDQLFLCRPGRRLRIDRRTRLRERAADPARPRARLTFPTFNGKIGRRLPARMPTS